MDNANISGLDAALTEKWSQLLNNIKGMKSAVVAFSGGVDSGLLSAAAYSALGEKMLAVNVQSPVNPAGEEDAAAGLAAQVGFPLEVVEFDDLTNPKFVENPADRCYHCKLVRLSLLKKLAHERGFEVVLEGSNASDGGDYRPGMRAVAELQVRSPLAEAGLTKTEIRQIAHALGLAVWDRPSAPCLATRFPYGTQVTRTGLQQVAAAEAFLSERGFEPLRVRHLGEGVRIEVAPAEIGRLVTLRDEIIPYIKNLGFKYVSIDLQGYRQGSMNEVLE
jgi:pyridinium-3,5-biscarboxylic acid mononucleotide sulfurtransferase